MWASIAASNIGDGLIRSLGPLLAASITRDPVLVAGVSIAHYLPWLLFTLFSGLVVDRADRRMLIIYGNSIRVVAVAILALGFLLEQPPLLLLYAVLFIVGLAETVVENASISVVPSVVPRERLDWANGRVYATFTVADQLAGPAVAGTLFTFSASIAVFTGSAAFLIAAVAAVFVRIIAIRPGDASEGRSVTADLRAGFAYFWSDRVMRELAIQAAVFNFAGGVVSGVLVLAVTGPMGLSAMQFGLFLAFTALGGVAAGFTAQRVIGHLGRGTVLLSGAVVSSAGMLLIGLTFNAMVSAGALFLIAATTTYGQVVTSTQRQATIPPKLLGRVVSVFRLVGLGVIPFGALAGGLLAQRFGLASVFLVAAVAHVSNGAFILGRLNNRRLRLPPQVSAADG